jgi:hypothetical protein
LIGVRCAAIGGVEMTWAVVAGVVALACLARLVYLIFNRESRAERRPPREYVEVEHGNGPREGLCPVEGKPGSFVDLATGEFIFIKALGSEKAMEEFLRTGVIPHD